MSIKKTNESYIVRRTAEAFDAIREKTGLNQREIAQELAITQSAVSAIYRAKVERPSDQTLLLLELRFRVNPTWLETGKGHMFLPERAEPMSLGGITISEDRFGFDITGTLEGWGRIMTYLHDGPDRRLDEGGVIGVGVARRAMEVEKPRAMVPTPLRIPDGYGRHKDYIMLAVQGSAPKGYLIIEATPSRRIEHLDGTLVTENASRITALFSGGWGTHHFADNCEAVVAVSARNRAYFRHLLSALDGLRDETFRFQFNHGDAETEPPGKK